MVMSTRAWLVHAWLDRQVPYVCGPQRTVFVGSGFAGLPALALPQALHDG
jgi:hypothetical protein